MIYKGEGIAINVGEQKVTYQELIQNIHLFASIIEKKSGFALIYSENRSEWIYSFYAAWCKGLIPVPVDFMAVKKDVEYIIKDCKPSVIFCSEKKKATLYEAYYNSGLDAQIIIVDQYAGQAAEAFPTQIDFQYQPDDTAVIIYTSGTTGSPKGVMLSFENIMANVRAVSIDLPIYTKDDTVLVLLPLHHIFPLLGTMVMPLFIGGMLALSPSMASDDIIKTMQVNKVTMIIGVPRLYAAIRKGIMDKINASFAAKTLFRLAQKINKQGFSRLIFKAVHQKFGGSVKFMVSGGAALDPEIAQDFYTLGFEVLEGYGMTEAAPMITFTRPGKFKVGSPGQPLKCCNVKIVNDEVVVSGPNIMKGYLGRKQETEDVLKDGWLYTGDLGYMDKKGFLFITGRRKEIIVLSNGKNINPSEIEMHLEGIHPVVKEAGVFQDGDRLRAIIVPNLDYLNEHSIDNEEAFIKWNVLNIYNKEVVPYKIVTNIIVAHEDLPRTRLGKLQRFLLKDLVSNGSQPRKQVVETTSEEFAILSHHFSTENKIAVNMNDHIEFDLGLDSLDKVNLQVFIESTFGVQLDVPELTKFENVGKLCEYIAANKTKSSVEKINWTEILKQKINLKLPSTWITSNLIVKASSLFFRIYFRFKGRGLKNIPEGPCIIVPNHQSFFDGLFVASFLGFKRMRKTFFYAKEKHVRGPFLKFLANRNNIIVMDLNNNLKESIQKMAEVLKKQKNLIIFPEGTRTTDGKLGDFKKTFAILSRELNIPIVPVTISGAFDALPRGRFIPVPFTKIKVEFLKPIYPDEHSYDSLSNLVKDNIQDKLETK
jgi:long-chain acyl-CoA synthetase